MMRDTRPAYRHFIQIAEDEWQVLWGAYAAFVWRDLDRWSVYRLSGSRLIDRDFPTHTAAIDAYWSIKE